MVKGQYKSVEKIFLAASFFYITYILAGVLAKPAWIEAMAATVKPPDLAAFKQDPYLYMVIGVVGTTIAPWMQFYLQSSIVEKGVSRRQYKASRWDVIVGCIFTDVVAWFIIVACAATLYVHGRHEIRDAADAAQALRPLAGKYAYILFSLGTVQRFAFCGVDPAALNRVYRVRRLGIRIWRRQEVLGGAGLLLAVYDADRCRRRGHLIPGLPLVKITVLSQVVNGAVLPFVLIFMVLLINKKELMGEFVNKPVFNTIAWATTVIMVGLTVLLVWGTLSGKAG